MFLIYESSTSSKKCLKPSEGFRHTVEMSTRRNNKIATVACDLMVYRENGKVKKVVAEDLDICSRDRMISEKRSWDSYGESRMPSQLAGSLSLTMKVLKEMLGYLKEEGFENVWFTATDARRFKAYEAVLKRLGMKVLTDKNPLYMKIEF